MSRLSPVAAAVLAASFPVAPAGSSSGRSRPPSVPPPQESCRRNRSRRGAQPPGPGPARAAAGAGRQGRDLAADAGVARRAHADDGPGRPARHRLRPRLRRRPHGGRGGEARPAGGRRRVQPRARRVLRGPGACAGRGAEGALRPGRHIRDGLLGCDGRDAVPALDAQHAAASDAARDAAGYARRLSRLHHGRLAPDEVSRAEHARPTCGSCPRPSRASGASTCRVGRPSTWRSCSTSRRSRARSRSARSRRDCASRCSVATRFDSASSTRVACGASSAAPSPATAWRGRFRVAGRIGGWTAIRREARR